MTLGEIENDKSRGINKFNSEINLYIIIVQLILIKEAHKIILGWGNQKNKQVSAISGLHNEFFFFFQKQTEKLK